MKTFTKFLLVPVVCQAMLVSHALGAKSDDPDDPNFKDKGGKRHEQSSPGQGQMPQPKKKMDPDFQPQKKQPQRQPDKDVQPQKKKSVSPDESSKTPKKPKNNPDEFSKKDQGSPRVQDKRPDDGGKQGAKNDHMDKGDKGDKKPMTLPGKRPGADPSDKADKNDKVGGNDKVDKFNKGDGKPMQLPGKRPGADTADKGDKHGKNDKTGKNDNPGTKPMQLPGKRPSMPPGLADKNPDRPGIGNRPGNNDLPNGMPGKRPNVPPGIADKNRPGENGMPGHPNLNKQDPKNKLARVQPVVRPGQNTKQVRRPDIQQNNTNNWWNSGNRINSGNKNVTVNNVTNINNNFRQSVNWNTSRHAWGYNPWWNRHAVRPWYGSSWNGGWNTGYYHHHYNYYGFGGYRPPGYYHNDVAEAIGWGLVGWSLGALVYDIGYHSYYNPYPVRPVPVLYGEPVNYSQPITQVAVRSAPADDAAIALSTSKSESLIGESQSAFKQKNYLVALELADKAIAESPGDGALHEYRALVLFALGKYGDAAGVLNPVLASGPGWDWSTMIALYDAQETYTDQLQKLEAYTEQKPDAADTHFLLGYHYMVCGHLDLATPQFDTAARLMPNDSVSKELAELTRSSAKPGEESAPQNADQPAEAPAPQPVPLEKLAGTWVSTREGGGAITLSFANDGKFNWSFVKEGKTSEFSGEYSINDNGLLVLDSKESQMVASVDLPQDKEMKFVLAGGPPADPGLAFVKN